jgi:hypothetical protein
LLLICNFHFRKKEETYDLEAGDSEPKILDFEDDVNQFKRYGIEGVVDCEGNISKSPYKR